MENSAPALSRRRKREAHALLTAVGVAATSGLLYELLLGTTASFLLGDTITEWSITLGIYLAAMGLGSYLSRFVRGDLLGALISLELSVALLGGFSVLLLFAVFAYGEQVFRPALILVVSGVGAAVGLEVPLLTRAIRHYGELRTVLSSVFAVDYGGSLVASLLYPLILYPSLGPARTALIASLFNLLGALLILAAYRHERGFPRRYLLGVGAVFLLILAGLAGATSLTSLIDARLYRPETLVYAGRSPYQHLAITTRSGGRRALYLNGHLQFFSQDEARYHEPLIRVPLALAANPAKVLVLGGGDGLAVRELLRDPRVEHITLVDLDPMVTDLAKTYPLLTELNHHALDDPRVTVINADAEVWVRTHLASPVGLIVVDLPDPSTPSLSRLYAVSFYRLLAAKLAPGGVLVTQAGSPYFARKAYWCIEASIAAASLHTLPYRVNVPSFGEWGFVAAAHEPLDPSGLRLNEEGRYLTKATLVGLFVFPPDMAKVPVKANTLFEPQLPQLFEAGWRAHLY